MGFHPLFQKHGPDICLIHKEQSVGQLKDEIKKKKSATIECDANMLHLFLAKKNGVWLTEAEVMEGVSDTTGLEPLKAARASLRFVGLSDEDVGGVNEADAAAGKGPVNVLVVVPERDGVPSRAMDVLDVVLYHVLTHAPTTLIEQTVDFKDDLREFYGYYRRKKRWVRCMLLDVAFPQSLVIASHLFRQSNEYLAPVLMKISDIDDVKNGLRLFKPLKHAFDHFQLSFILDDTNVFRLKLFDPNIRDLRLADLMDRDGNKVLSAQEMRVLENSVSLTRNGCLFDTQTTFGEVGDVHWVRATVRSLFVHTGKNGPHACFGEAKQELVNLGLAQNVLGPRNCSDRIVNRQHHRRVHYEIVLPKLIDIFVLPRHVLAENKSIVDCTNFFMTRGSLILVFFFLALQRGLAVYRNMQIDLIDRKFQSLPRSGVNDLVSVVRHWEFRYWYDFQIGHGKVDAQAISVLKESESIVISFIVILAMGFRAMKTVPISIRWYLKAGELGSITKDSVEPKTLYLEATQILELHNHTCKCAVHFLDMIL